MNPPRKSRRKPSFDYTRPGAYFITLCTHEQQPLFGHVEEGQMALSPWGEIVVEEWECTAALRPSIKTDAFVVMPTHAHGVLWLHADPEEWMERLRSGRARPPTTEAESRRSVPGSLSTIMGSFKSAVTRRINMDRKTPGGIVWQDDFFDHIVRSEEALYFIRRYIVENPRRWHLDKYNENAIGEDPWARELWDLLQRDARERL